VGGPHDGGNSEIATQNEIVTCVGSESSGRRSPFIVPCAPFLTVAYLDIGKEVLRFVVWIIGWKNVRRIGTSSGGSVVGCVAGLDGSIVGCGVWQWWILRMVEV
jgi:hypothetical protein